MQLIFFEGEYEESLDLRKILKSEFFDKNKISDDVLDLLLKKGIISSAMLRAMKKDALQNLNLDKVLKNLNFDSVVDSVENPSFKPLIKIRDNKIVVVENSEVVPRDFISPLPASHPNGVGVAKRNCDSMGSYQMSPEELKTDQFGDAIFEIRAIGYAYNKKLGNRMYRKGDMIPNLFLSEIEYFTSDFLSLFRLIKSHK